MGSSLDKKIESQWIPHAEFAKWLVKKKDPKLIVDLGTYQGVSAIALGINNKGRTVTIDKSQGAEYVKVMEDVISNIEIKKGLFDDFLDEFEDHSIDILHIDGDHKLDSVVNDVNKWVPKLARGGILLMHDVWNPAFYGPLKVFVDGVRGYRLLFPVGAGLGIASVDKNIIMEIYKEFHSEVIVESLFKCLLGYSERKNAWIKGLSESSVRERVLNALSEKTDLLSTMSLSE